MVYSSELQQSSRGDECLDQCLWCVHRLRVIVVLVGSVTHSSMLNGRLMQHGQPLSASCHWQCRGLMLSSRWQQLMQFMSGECVNVVSSAKQQMHLVNTLRCSRLALTHVSMPWTQHGNWSTVWQTVPNSAVT